MKNDYMRRGFHYNAVAVEKVFTVKIAASISEVEEWKRVKYWNKMIPAILLSTECVFFAIFASIEDVIIGNLPTPFFSEGVGVWAGVI